jgi:PAS domain S-box-containing protein
MAALPEDRALLEVLLEHARHALEADHVTFCAWDPAAGTLQVLGAAGSLPAAEVQPGPAFPIGELDMDAYAPVGSGAVVHRRKGKDTQPAVREFLGQIGAAGVFTVPVLDPAGGRWLVEVFFTDPTRQVEAWELREATELAPLAATAFSRDALTSELERVEGRFQTLVEQLPAITYVDRADGLPLYTSPQVETLLGFSIDEWQSSRESWLSKVHPDDRERVRAEADASIAADKPIDVEYRIIAADGRVVWFYDRARVISRDGGRTRNLQGVMLDITDRRAAEQALQESEARRSRVLEEMLRAQEAERARIAVDLHDDTIQVMTATLFLLDRLAWAVADGDLERIAEGVARARETLGEAVDRTRRLTFELRPPLLESQGLGAAVRDLADEASREAGFAAEVKVTVGRHPTMVEELAYRTVAEAIANVRRHAAASVLRVRLWEEGGRLQGEVADNGRGFDLPAALDRSAMRLHLGLDAMRERLLLAGGDVAIDSRHGEGTRVCFSIPLA